MEAKSNVSLHNLKSLAPNLEVYTKYYETATMTNKNNLVRLRQCILKSDWLEGVMSTVVLGHMFI